ncbi:lipase secretion chaperone [Acinetobacter calcoaceticus]
MHLKKCTLIWLLFGVCLIVTLMIWWLKPTKQINNDQSAEIIESRINREKEDPRRTDGQINFSSASQQDTEVNCQIRSDSSDKLIVNEETKNCFEYFITQYGEKSIAQIKADFLGYTKLNYRDPLLSQLNDLWSRYLQYSEQLANLQNPNISPERAEYYQQIFSNIKNLQKQFFSNYEIEGLFGNEDTYNEYTIKRMNILNNKDMSTNEKAKKLKDLFNSLPEDWKENIQELSQLEDLRKLTAEIKANGNSAEELRQMRTNLVGPEATLRLENLDTQRDQWKQRVNQYLEGRDIILKSSMSDSAKQNAVDQLRKQQFNTQQEQIRLQTFEHVHDKGGQLPFSN